MSDQNSLPKVKSHITGIYIKEKDGRFTAFFSEIPEATAQGDSMEDAEKALFSILPDVLEFKNELHKEDGILNTANSSITRKSYNFELSNYKI